MDDILFPLWVTRSPAMAIAATMRTHFKTHAEFHSHSSREQQPLKTSEVSDAFSPHVNSTTFPSSTSVLSPPSSGVATRQNESRNNFSVGCMGFRVSGEGGLAQEPEFSPASYPNKSHTTLADLLHSPYVQQLMRASHINSVAAGQQQHLSVRQCAAVLALMAIAVESKNLSHEVTRGFLTECSALYSAFVARLPSIRFAEGVDVEEFCASLVACGLQLRAEEEELVGGVMRSSGSGGRFTSMKSVALSGFGYRVIDRAILCCLPDDIDQYVSSPVARGTLRGLCFTRSRRVIFWGPDLVKHIQELTDLFAESPKKEHSHKRVLMLLLEAMSCSKSVMRDRTSRWIAAILQESYVISGLLQKNLLHSRVVAATLSLLIRHYQDTVSQFSQSALPGAEWPDFSEGDFLIDMVWRALQRGTAERDMLSSRCATTLYGANLQVVLFHLLYVELERLKCLLTLNRCGRGGETAHQDSTSAALAPTAEPLQDSVTDTRGTRQLAVGGPPLPTTTTGSGVFDGSGMFSGALLAATSSSSIFPSPNECAASTEEESVRVRAVSNIIKFILNPDSVFALLPRKGKGSAIRANICNSLARVLAVLTSGAEVGPAVVGFSCADRGEPNSGRVAQAADLSPSSASPSISSPGLRNHSKFVGATAAAPTSPVRTTFSNQYYRNMEGMAHLLMNTMVREHGGTTDAFSGAAIETFIMNCDVTPDPNVNTNPSEIPKSSAASICLIGLCGSDPHIRFFTVSALLDFGSKVCSTVDDLIRDSGSWVPIPSVNLVFDTISRILVPTSTTWSIDRKRSLARCGTTENMVRCAQLICTSYATLVKGECQAAGSSLASLMEKKTFPTVGMIGSSSVFAELVNRVLIRLSDLVKCRRAELQSTAEWKEATEETIHIAKILLHEAQTCVLNIAWPASGVLYQNISKCEISNISAKGLHAAAARCIAPFLKPIAILLHLIPFQRELIHEELAFRVDKCMRMIIEEGDEQSRYMCYFGNRFELETPVECCSVLFRSCWLLFSFYGMSADSVALSRPRLIKDVSNTKLQSALTFLEVRQIVKCAAASRSLLLMRSTHLQQVEADIKVLLNHMKYVMGQPHLSDKKVKKILSAEILRVCPKSKKDLDKLSVFEVFLMRAILELELVHAAAGSFAPITVYHQFDVREFVASAAIPKVLRHITEYACNQFIASCKNCSIPDLAFRLLRRNTRQLLLYATFSVRSVRECAVFFLRELLRSFPMQIVQSGVLPLLWRLIDVVEVADSDEIASFCAKARYLGAPALPIEYKSAERTSQLQDLQNLSEEWVETARQRAPIDLLHVATHFVTSSYADSVSVENVHMGTRLAIMAGQIKATSLKKVEEKGTSSVIKFSRAKGSILSALAYASAVSVEETIVQKLRTLVQEGQEMLRWQAKCKQTLSSGRDSQVPTNDLPESFLAQLEGELYAATVMLDIPTRRLQTRGLLLLYLVQSPIKLFSTKAIKIASECWSWLIISHRQTLVIPILRNIVEGIQWTFASKLGIFDGEQCRQREMVETGVNTSCAVSPTRETPHQVLFQFVVDNYLHHDSVMSQNPAVLSLVFILSSLMVQNTTSLSLKDASFVETMQGMVLVGKTVHQLFIANIRHLRANRTASIPFTSIGTLRQRWYKALLHWFRKSPSSWYFASDLQAAPHAIAVLESLLLLLHTERKSLRQNSAGFVDFSSNLSVPGKNIGHLSSCRRRDLVHPMMSAERMTEICEVEQTRLRHLLHLLIMLVDHELLRIRVWQQPRRTLNLTNTMETYKSTCETSMASAAVHDPAVAVAMVRRFATHFPQMAAYLTRHVARHPEFFLHVPEAADYYLTSHTILQGAPSLYLFANLSIIQSLRLLDARYSSNAVVASFAIRSLLSQNSEHLIFYLPQLLQVLGSDTSGRILNFLENMSRGSMMFCHQLLWALRTEGEGSHDLAKKCQKLEGEILKRFSTDEKAFYLHEFEFIDTVIALSGELMKYEKLDRKPNLRRRLKDESFHFPPKVYHLYLPTNPDFRVTDVIPHTASAMQSAAKCPIFVQFEGTARTLEETTPPSEASAVVKKGLLKKACIFKMGDDCRQDQIALQLIELFRRILQTVGVQSFLYPYRVVTTGQTSGIIECVPNSLSRNEIGKLVESNLAEYFVQTFGYPETTKFRRARENFVKSAAAYSIVTFVLNIKDRHNGNIMVDADGNLVHIDFGFLFDTSPGGDMNFESSPFKLTTEMIQLIGRDVGSSSTLQSPALVKALIDEDNYITFKVLANRCYMAIREYARDICILVELLLRSGLPCFKPQQTIENLAKRLSMDANEMQAAHFMRQRIHESKQNVRTKLYDHFQRIVEGIEM